MGTLSAEDGRKRSEAAGATLRPLPPDNPALTPLAEVSSPHARPWLRHIATRTLASLWNALGDALDLFSTRACAHVLPDMPVTINLNEASVPRGSAASVWRRTRAHNPC